MVEMALDLWLVMVVVVVVGLLLLLLLLMWLQCEYEANFIAGLRYDWPKCPWNWPWLQVLVMEKLMDTKIYI
jgi:hypothetical protein